MNRNKKYWKDEADRLFSLWIRQRDADGNGYCRCITCNTLVYWRYIDCGHYQERGKENTRYEEENANAQCKTCNNSGGYQKLHGKEIDLKHGQGTSHQLKAISRTTCHRSWNDYRLICEDLRKKLLTHQYEIR